jgi:uncharacterized membrane protein
MNTYLIVGVTTFLWWLGLLVGAFIFCALCLLLMAVGAVLGLLDGDSRDVGE